ncbi:nucleotidyltransferase family protein [Donghicola mangrovi]
MTKNLQDLMVSLDATIRESIAAIDRGARQIALVVDGENRLLGVVTDGDIRRALLRGVDIQAPVSEIVERRFSYVTELQGYAAARRLMREKSIHHVPILGPDNEVLDLVSIDDVSGLRRRDTEVILMAGGLGTRLRPLTETVPKPMLPVGGRPLLELIIENFVEQGFTNFTVSLNYKGEMISDHFGDGAAFGARIKYQQETQRMGTAGALSLLPERPNAPFVVMNGDLLTSMRFDALESFHIENGSIATMCAREYSVQVPYGVIETEGSRLSKIVEKPVHNHYVNAGIYMLSPEALDFIEPETPLDMPVLFERLVEAERIASVFPMREYWIDIGRIEDLERARTEYPSEFVSK